MNVRQMSGSELRELAAGDTPAAARKELRRRIDRAHERKQERREQVLEARRRDFFRSLAPEGLEWIAGRPWPLEGSEPRVRVPFVELDMSRVEAVERAEAELERRQAPAPEPVSTRAPRSRQPAGRLLTEEVAGIPVWVLVLGAAGAVVVLSGSGSGGRSVRVPEPEVSDGKVECPECGERFARNGINGHLRWSHDWSAERAGEFGEKINGGEDG